MMRKKMRWIGETLDIYHNRRSSTTAQQSFGALLQRRTITTISKGIKYFTFAYGSAIYHHQLTLKLWTLGWRGSDVLRLTPTMHHTM